MSTSVVILAAGRGERMQVGENKVFTLLGGEPLFLRTGKLFAQIPEVEDMVFVVRPEDENRMRELWGTRLPRVRWVHGGATRRDSSLAGVRAASGDLVLIHDAARPFASAALIRRVVEAAQRSGAAIPVLPVVDLLHAVDGETLVPRRMSSDPLHAAVKAQTPQGFLRERILACLELAGPDVRDDATAVLLQGHPVHVVPGDPCNIKLTHPRDLPLAEAIVRSGQQTSGATPANSR